MKPVTERVQLLQPESLRLKHYLQSLPNEAWSQPSACGEWQIQDVVAHLTGPAMSYFDWISRGLQGETSPPEGRPAAGSANAGSIAERIAQRAVATREQLGDQLLATLESANDALNELLLGINDQDWDTLCYQPIGIIPVSRFVDLRLQELVIHGWDIRSRFEPDVSLNPECLPSLLNMLDFMTPAWAFWPGEKLDVPIHYHFAVTGPAPETTDIVVEGDTLRIATPSHTQPQITFHCNTETYVLVRYGRLLLKDAIAAGRVRVEGEQALAIAFGEWFQGI